MRLCLAHTVCFIFEIGIDVEVKCATTHQNKSFMKVFEFSIDSYDNFVMKES